MGPGEAPFLSSTYAQYDNGANVFQYYQRFGGVGVVGVVSAGSIVNVDEYTELTVSDTASVRITLNCSGLFDVSADTVVYVKVFEVAETPTPTNPTIDSGQSVTLSSSWSGGTPTYTIKWYTGPSGNSCSGLFDVSADTVVYVKVLDVAETPVNSMFAVIAFNPDPVKLPVKCQT